MQLGFVLDQSRCIGCHACTIACKAENDVPLGSFRTFVKYVEEGEFPAVKRSFAVLRCNQCSAAPCVTICPTGALSKHGTGIVDIDPRSCIGCKACMQGCPYDAIYISPSKGTAEKCHFCAHRTEQGLAPACAIVCPTEAIIPGDFDDPDSVVSRLRDHGGLTVRKPEAGTRPNVLYKGAGSAVLDPKSTTAAGGYLWSRPHPSLDPAVENFRALDTRAQARTTYDVDHPPPWGPKITHYLFTKSVAAGAFLAALPLLPPWRAAEEVSRAAMLLAPILGFLFLALTSALLVADLKRPERFYFILTRPNWSSWLTRGTFALMGYGGLLSVWLLLGLLDVVPGRIVGTLLALPTALLAALSACYTGWLFAQAKARVLWMRRGLWLHLIVQALIAGAGLLLLLAPGLELGAGAGPALRAVLVVSLIAHVLFIAYERRLAPRGREDEYGRVMDLVGVGPFAARHWWLGVFVGVALPLVLLTPDVPALWAAASVLALMGLHAEEDILVRAGQAMANS